MFFLCASFSCIPLQNSLAVLLQARFRMSLWSILPLTLTVNSSLSLSLIREKKRTENWEVLIFLVFIFFSSNPAMIPLCVIFFFLYFHISLTIVCQKGHYSPKRNILTHLVIQISITRSPPIILTRRPHRLICKNRHWQNLCRCKGQSTVFRSAYRDLSGLWFLLVGLHLLLLARERQSLKICWHIPEHLAFLKEAQQKALLPPVHIEYWVFALCFYIFSFYSYMNITFKLFNI